jgi:hypothetical protein
MGWGSWRGLWAYPAARGVARRRRLQAAALSGA